MCLSPLTIPGSRHHQLLAVLYPCSTKTREVLVGYGQSLSINFSTGSGSENPSLWTVLKSILPCWWWQIAVRSAVHLCCVSVIKFVEQIIQLSLHIIQSTLIFHDLGNPQPFVKKLYFTYEHLPSNGLLDLIHFWVSFTDQLSWSLLKFDVKCTYLVGARRYYRI